MPKIFRAPHELPSPLRYDYILLPYGVYYKKTAEFLDAKASDTLRFFNGPDVPIVSVQLVEQRSVVDALCLMRYGVPWMAAFRKWLSYARMEGNGRDILDKDKCIMVVYGSTETASEVR
jgi:hypothetical protein